MNRALFLILTGGLVSSAHAHHSNDYHFDPNVDVTVAGTVNAFRFINPHARLLIDVTNENGDIVTWDCEMSGANSLMRRGWTQEIFGPGDEIVVQGIAARRDPTECYFHTAELGDGRRIALRDSFEIDAMDSQPAVVALADEILEFNGVWRWTPPPDYSGAPPIGSPNLLAWVLNEAGQRALSQYDPVVDDPALICSPVSIRRLWGNTDLTRIEQTDESLVIRHEWMDAVREVHLGMRDHPENVEESVLGHSIGWYEGSTLVIDTIGYQAGVIAQRPGLPNSNQLHTVERLTLAESGDTFEITMIFEDPLYFNDQLIEARSFAASDQTPRRYNCTH
jgi:hypothetical protein